LVVSYLDSSGLLRLCLREGDTSLVTAALAASPVASVLVLVEVPNGLSARFHRSVIDAKRRGELLERANILLGKVNLLELTADVLDEAVGAGARFPVRTLDAIHLGTAVVAARQQARWGNQVRFCTADVRQFQAAEALFGAHQVDLVEPL
jgi:predicted nucleic acid-binding protein